MGEGSPNFGEELPKIGEGPPKFGEALPHLGGASPGSDGWGSTRVGQTQIQELTVTPASPWDLLGTALRLGILSRT